MPILDKLLDKINRWINGPPNQIYSICQFCGRRYRYFKGRGFKAGFCTANCEEQSRWECGA